MNVQLIAGKELGYTIARPKNAEGLEADVQWGIRVSQKQQADEEAKKKAWDWDYKNSNDHVDCMSLGKDLIHCTQY